MVVVGIVIAVGVGLIVVILSMMMHNVGAVADELAQIRWILEQKREDEAQRNYKSRFVEKA
ncbi:MAG: hypothetical protein ABSF23_11250 [Terracidiphilus sp.]